MVYLSVSWISSSKQPSIWNPLENNLLVRITKYHSIPVCRDKLIIDIYLALQTHSIYHVKVQKRESLELEFELEIGFILHRGGDLGRVNESFSSVELYNISM